MVWFRRWFVSSGYNLDMLISGHLGRHLGNISYFYAWVENGWKWSKKPSVRNYQILHWGPKSSNVLIPNISFLALLFFGQWQCVKVWCWTNPTRKGLLTVDCGDESAVSGDSSVDRGRSEQLQPGPCLPYLHHLGHGHAPTPLIQTSKHLASFYSCLGFLLPFFRRKKRILLLLKYTNVSY